MLLGTKGPAAALADRAAISISTVGASTVWPKFAATIFEMIAYPYHKMRAQCYYDPTEPPGGAPCGMEMTR